MAEFIAALFLALTASTSVVALAFFWAYKRGYVEFTDSVFARKPSARISAQSRSTAQIITMPSSVEASAHAMNIELDFVIGTPRVLFFEAGTNMRSGRQKSRESRTTFTGVTHCYNTDKQATRRWVQAEACA